MSEQIRNSNPSHVSNNNYVSSEPGVLPSRILRFIDDVTAEVELRAARVAAGHEPDGELEKQFHSILQATKDDSPERFPSIQQNMAKPMQWYKSDRRFATFAHLDIAEPCTLDTVDLAAKHRPAIAPFSTSWVHIPAMVDGLVKPERLSDPLIPQGGYKGLKFYITKVKCVDETDGFLWSEAGHDEIYLGGNFVDETGDVSHTYFNVGNYFDDGDVKDYGFPGKQIQYFNLTEGGNKFPKIYTAAISMVEEDWGNMAGWFKDLYEKVKAGVKSLLKEAGYALGSLIGLGDLGALIGTILGKIFEWLIGWIVSIFENDYMGTFKTSAVINSYSGNWVATGGPIYSWSKGFKAHGGHYHVWYAWELVK